MENVPMMSSIQITEADVCNAIKYTSNWKSPGLDQIQNYWLKHFTNIYPVLDCQFQHCIQNPSELPKFLTEGITYMLPKNEKIDNPASYRPVTCLSTIYKLLTSILKNKIYDHIQQHTYTLQETKYIFLCYWIFSLLLFLFSLGICTSPTLTLSQGVTVVNDHN
uniref:Reverse transcriptase n=1 Tax=Cacopsylla melanoneura TaxID=428564 RepID=A0A8D8Z094_9HEMI